MGLFFYSREAYDLAISEFKRALQASLFPVAALHVNLGAAYLGKKMYGEARACFLRGLALEPNNQKGHWLLGRTLAGMGLVSDALVELERTRALKPESPEGKQAADEIRVLSSSRARSSGGGER
jgi:tetratricopeptide (TPR) repeat protein